jgi:hypothetical protein
MLPHFDENGYLPPGLHRCTLEEMVARFGLGSPERETETEELIELVRWARGAGIKRLVLAGSYVTIKESPNDVDLVILPGQGYPRQTGSVQTLVEQRPFLHVIVAADEADLDWWIRVGLAEDRAGIPRGLVEIEV